MSGSSSAFQPKNLRDRPIKAARELTKKPGLAQDQNQAEQRQLSPDSDNIDLQSSGSVTTSTKDQSIQALGAKTEA